MFHFSSELSFRSRKLAVFLKYTAGCTISKCVVRTPITEAEFPSVSTGPKENSVSETEYVLVLRQRAVKHLH
jgi:hypothetical protein